MSPLQRFYKLKKFFLYENSLLLVCLANCKCVQLSSVHGCTSVFERTLNFSCRIVFVTDVLQHSFKAFSLLCATVLSGMDRLSVQVGYETIRRHRCHSNYAVSGVDS